MNDSAARPTTYWVIAVIGLIWNLFGCFQFFTEYNFWKNPESREILPEAMRGLYDQTPGWLYVIFAIAVAAGTIGCIGLLMKKSWAVHAFLLSLITVIIQMGYSLFGAGMFEALGATSIIMPLIVILVAGFLWNYAKSSHAKGWLS